MGYGMFAPLPKYKFDADEPPIVATWSGLGVCALAVEAVVKNYPDCLEGLLSAKVHVGISHWHRPGYYYDMAQLMLMTTVEGRWDCLQKIMNAKGEITANEIPAHYMGAYTEKLRLSTRQEEFWKTTKINLGLETMDEMKPIWVLEQAKAGTLKVTEEVNPNFVQPDQPGQPDDEKKTGLTPLMMAAAAGHYTVVDDLIKQDADIHTQTRQGLTALAFAADFGFVEGTTRCFALLLEARANINHRVGKTYTREVHRLRGLQTYVAHAICRIGDDEKLKLLLKAKMDVNLTNDLGTPPLFEAVYGGNTECVRQLFAAKASVHHKMHTVRWPDGKEPMCICSFTDMHAEKGLPTIKLMVEELGLSINHGFVAGRDFKKMFWWSLKGPNFVRNASGKDLFWCLDNGLDQDSATWQVTSRQNPNPTMSHGLSYVIQIFSLFHTSAVNVVFELWDRMETKTGPIGPTDGHNGIVYTGWHFVSVHQRMTGNWWCALLMSYWNDYQTLLASRGVE